MGTRSQAKLATNEEAPGVSAPRASGSSNKAEVTGMDNIIPQINSRQAVALAGRADREQAAMQRSGYVVMALSSLLHDTLDCSGEESSVITDWHRGAILQALQTIGNDLCHRGEALEDLLAGVQGGAA